MIWIKEHTVNKIPIIVSDCKQCLICTKKYKTSETINYNYNYNEGI